ncbi:unnamed protein product [Linum tenue]|uniref:Uncharacterized protein n=2 Tax=Linum tenue TaxID=586396 RepID=A0AAV0HA29_9ROSI|nr:unnamed protein product [Linum tenue]
MPGCYTLAAIREFAGKRRLLTFRKTMAACASDGWRFGYCPVSDPLSGFEHGTGDTAVEFVPRSSSASVSVTAVSSSTVCFSSSDPVLVPSNDSRPAGTVGTIKREVGSHRTLSATNVAPNSQKSAGSTKEWKPKTTNSTVAQVSGIASSTEVRNAPVDSVLHQFLNHSQLQEVIWKI